MTEYDYSPEAYDRYMENQARIARWVDETDAHANEFSPGAPEIGIPSSGSAITVKQPFPLERHSHHHRHHHAFSGHHERPRMLRRSSSASYIQVQLDPPRARRHSFHSHDNSPVEPHHHSWLGHLFPRSFMKSRRSSKRSHSRSVSRSRTGTPTTLIFPQSQPSAMLTPPPMTSPPISYGPYYNPYGYYSHPPPPQSYGTTMYPPTASSVTAPQSPPEMAYPVPPYSPPAAPYQGYPGYAAPYPRTYFPPVSPPPTYVVVPKGKKTKIIW